MARGAVFGVYKTFIAGEIFYHSDANGMQTQIVNNLDPSGVGSYFTTLAEMRVVSDPADGVPASLKVLIEYILFKIKENITKWAAVIGDTAPSNWDDDISSLSLLSVLNKTANYTVTAGNCNGLTEFNNAGDANAIVFTLPNATAGLKVKIRCSYQVAGTTDTVTINPDAGDTFTVGATTGLTSLTTSVIGSVWELTCEVADVWIASLKGVQPSCRVYPNAAYTINVSAWAKILINTANHDNNNMLASNKVSPTIPGCYIIDGAVQGVWSGATVNRDIGAGLYLNGLIINDNIYGSHISYSGTVNGQAKVSDVRILDNNDYIELYGRNDTGGTCNGNTDGQKTYLTVTRISD